MEPFIGEIRLFPLNFAPHGWVQCNGQVLPINQYAALSSILGTTYGGDGRTNFALPDLRGRVAVHPGNGVTLGQSAGEEEHTLTAAELPAHTHAAMGDTGTSLQHSPAGHTWGKPAASSATPYGNTPNVTMNPTAIGTAGASQPHPNLQPYLVLNYCIATVGIYPPRD